VYTDVTGDTLHGNIKGHHVGVRGRMGPDRLGCYNRRGYATKFGELTGLDNRDSEAGGKFGHVLRFCKYFSVVSGTARCRHFHAGAFLAPGLEPWKDVSQPLQVFMLSCRCRRWMLSARLLIHSVLTAGLNRFFSWRALKIKNALLAKEPLIPRSNRVVVYQCCRNV